MQTHTPFLLLNLTRLRVVGNTRDFLRQSLEEFRLFANASFLSFCLMGASGHLGWQRNSPFGVRSLASDTPHQRRRGDDSIPMRT